MFRALNIIEGTGAVRQDKGSLANTILDPKFSGKTFHIDLEQFVPGGVKLANDLVVRKLSLPWELRRTRTSDGAGCLVLDRLLVAYNSILQLILQRQDEIAKTDTLSIAEKMSVLRSISSSYCYKISLAVAELVAALDVEKKRVYQEQLGRVRNDQSAMMVGIPALGVYNDAKPTEMFTARRFAERQFSDVMPWQVVITKAVFAELACGTNISADNLYLLVGRFPTTNVIALRARVVPGEDLTIGFSNKTFTYGSFKDGKAIHTQDLLEGDFDGDCYTLYLLESAAAISEMQSWNKKFQLSLEMCPEAHGSLFAHVDHEYSTMDIGQTYQNKIRQKLLVGPWSLRMYEGFVVIDNMTKLGVKTPLTPERWKSCSTQVLESIFDLKHDSESYASLVNGCLMAIDDETYDWLRIRDKLSSAGIDTEAIGWMLDLLGGESIRQVACMNSAYAILHGGYQEVNPVHLFESSVSEDKSLASAYQQLLVPHFTSSIVPDFDLPEVEVVSRVPCTEWNLVRGYYRKTGTFVEPYNRRTKRVEM